MKGLCDAGKSVAWLSLRPVRPPALRKAPELSDPREKPLKESCRHKDYGLHQLPEAEIVIPRIATNSDISNR